MDAPSEGPPRATAVTREDGSYELLLDEPGWALAYLETVDGKIALGQRDANIPDADAHALDLKLTGAPLSGMVIDGRTGQPIPWASVSLYGERGFPSGSAGPDGHFTLEVEPGDYQIRVSAEGYDETEQMVGVDEAGLTDLRIALRRKKEGLGRN